MRDITFEEENIGILARAITIGTDGDRVIIPNTTTIANPERIVDQNILVLPPTNGRTIHSS